MGDVSGLVKPKGLIGRVWDKATARAEALTDDDETVLFVGFSSAASPALVGAGAAFGALGAVLVSMVARTRKLEGIAGTFPRARTVIVLLTDRRFGIGPQKATPDEMVWVGRDEISAVAAEGTKLRVRFTDMSEQKRAFQANSRVPLKTAVEQFLA